jgi:hypothetical protein
MNAIENNLFHFDIAFTEIIQNSNLQKSQEIEINKL